MKTLDLFAGVGGFRLGFDNAGYKCAFANDIEPKTKTTYDLNFTKPNLHIEDIYDISISSLPDFDVLTGGFPCQSFSIAGKRLGFKDGARGNLFYQIADILRLRRPSTFLLENVKNLTTHDGGNTFSTIQETLKGLDYNLHYQVLNTKNYGVPQNRERIFIVGSLSNKPFVFPEPQLLITFIEDLLDDEVDEEFLITPNHKHYQTIVDGVVRTDTIYQFRRSYIRENKSQLCPTITAAMGGVLTLVRTKQGVRMLTPRELFRFQGFPDSYKLPTTLSYKDLHHQAGNSVSVPVIQSLAERMLDLL